MASTYGFQAYATVAILLIVAIRFLTSQLGVSGRKLRLPPGPSSLPIVGNLLQLPAIFKERTFTEWAKQYGDVVYVRFLRTPVIILNTLEAAQDLLDKRSSKYSDRPQITIVSDMAGWDSSIVGMPYGDRFRRYRKWMHDALGTKAGLKTLIPTQQREAYNLISGLCEKPEALQLHINRFAAGLLVEMGYGHTITTIDDAYVHLADRAMGEIVEGGYPGLMFVDFIPKKYLKRLPMWFPGPVGWFLRKSRLVAAAAQMMLDTPFEMVKKAMAAGTARPSLTSSVLAEMQSQGKVTEQDEIDIKGAAGVLYAAGTETTVSTLSSFFLAMVIHPDIYRKAQEEMDRVIGYGRLPELDDRVQLPYLGCILKEVYRWGCPAPLGLVHRLMSDDEYRGYDIPEGSTVLPNIWAMTRDERCYPEPESFRPERFLNTNESEVPDPRNMVFGFGRRICPGRLMADDSLWLAMANIVATLKIEKVVGPGGEKITPKAVWTSGFINQPIDLKCDVRPRSQESLDLIHQMSAHIVN